MIHLTETVLVTIYGTIIPSKIKLFYMIEKIRPFYDRPRQYLNCWQFDHAAKKCKNETVCRKCSENHATATFSNVELTCTNCQAAPDPKCLASSKEMDFLKYNHLSITEAPRQYAKTSKPENYAEAVKANTEPTTNATYVTKADLEQTFELFFQHTQECILQVLQQQANFFLQAMEGLVNSFTARHRPHVPPKSRLNLPPN